MKLYFKPHLSSPPKKKCFRKNGPISHFLSSALVKFSLSPCFTEYYSIFAKLYQLALRTVKVTNVFDYQEMIFKVDNLS